MLGDDAVRQLAGDTLFWLAEGLFSQGFDFKTNSQSPESIAKAKGLLQLARDRTGNKPQYLALLSQVQMSENAPRKADATAKRVYSMLPEFVLSDYAQTKILRSELLRLKANAAVALGSLEEAEFGYLAAKDFNPKIQGVDETLRSLRRMKKS